MAKKPKANPQDEANRNIFFQRKIDSFRPLDDTFMNELFRDQKDLVQMVLRTVLESNDLQVEKVLIQDQYTNWQGRAIRIDVFARDLKGKLYDIEIQRAKHGAGAKRARFNLSAIDNAYTAAGTAIPEPHETYVIFITETDVFNRNLPVYHIERVIQETGELFDDEGHIVYVNGAYVGEDPIGILMHDFRCSDPGKMKNDMLRERARQLKGSQEWRDHMCEVLENIKMLGYNEGVEVGLEKGLEKGLEQGSRRAIIKLFKKGLIPSNIAADQLNISEDEFIALAAECKV